MTSARTVHPDLDLDELEVDPYPTFARLQRDAPVFRSDRLGGWVLTRWQECHPVLTDNERFGPAPQDALTERVVGGLPVVSADGDAHQDLRSGLVKPMRPSALKDFIDEMVRPVARARLAALDGVIEAELMETYFEPISVRALGDVLGLTEVPDATLRRWFFGIVSGFVNVGMSEDGFEVSDEIRAEIDMVVRPMLERLLHHPDESVLSHMLHGGRDGGEPRSVEEVIPTLIVYITGGMQEPGHGAGNTLMGLMSNPEQLSRVIADPALIPRAVNEGLRWIAPLGSPRRTVRARTELAGVTVAAGDRLTVMVGAANRDPERFPHPERFDIDRPNPNHLAFGGGVHVCVGHFFGRAIGRIALEELFAAYPALTPSAKEEAVVRGWRFRAPRQLPVRLL